MAVWGSLWSFGIFFLFWYFWTNKNLATLHHMVNDEQATVFLYWYLQKPNNEMKNENVFANTPTAWVWHCDFFTLNLHIMFQP
jgi:hypothetical protein